ncbi:MAG: hypothetical protein QOF02_2219 [Blastocatellia bacterium]|nr:hypothetical protein [Blastocatellia bacterium]
MRLTQAPVRLAHARLTIDTLICENATINISYSSTVRIGELKCSGTVNIHDSYASTIVIDKGDTNVVTGLIEYSSLGKCFAKIKRDEVKVETASTWRT